MQNQIALYLIFATGVILIIGAILDSDYLFGLKNSNKNNSTPSGMSSFLSKFLNSIANVFSFILPKTNGETDVHRRNKRVLFVIFGILIIILGIFALNSGKFS